MRIMKKHCTFADMKFDIAIDRNMVGNIFDACPYILDVMDEISEANSVEDENEKKELKIGDDVSSVLKKTKMVSFMKYMDRIEDAVAYALPFMLEKAGEDKSLSEKILDIANKYNLDRVYEGFWDFIMSAFISSESEEAKAIVFTME